MKKSRQAQRDADQLWRFCQVNGALDEGRARRVVEQLAASGHSRGAAVLSHFLRLLKLDRDRWTARVDSAAPLDESTKSAMQQGLTRRYGHDVTVTFGVDRSLIGGMRVKMGSDVYDGSVRAGLDALEARF